MKINHLRDLELSVSNIYIRYYDYFSYLLSTIEIKFRSEKVIEKKTFLSETISASWKISNEGKSIVIADRYEEKRDICVMLYWKWL